MPVTDATALPALFSQIFWVDVDWAFLGTVLAVIACLTVQRLLWLRAARVSFPPSFISMSSLLLIPVPSLSSFWVKSRVDAATRMPCKREGILSDRNRSDLCVSTQKCSAIA